MKRRAFMGSLAASAVGLARALNAEALARVPWNGDPPATLPKRPLGRTGEKLSIIGLGGLVVADETQETADALVREAFEAGVNYYDVAPSYGNAEDRLGPALEPFRKEVFLACKTLVRDAKGAAVELENSLRKLRTDHFDLYQMHALSKMEDVTQALGPGGAVETFVKAKKEGKIRFLGFSAHSAEAALAAMRQFAFDTILFPVNFVSFLGAGFGPQMMAAAREKGMGILALKALAFRPWPEGAARSEWPKCWYEPILDPALAELSLRFTLSQPVTAAVPPGDKRLFRKAVELAPRFRPLTGNEEATLRKIAASTDPLFRPEPAGKS